MVYASGTLELDPPESLRDGDASAPAGSRSGPARGRSAYTLIPLSTSCRCRRLAQLRLQPPSTAAVGEPRSPHDSWGNGRCSQSGRVPDMCPRDSANTAHGPDRMIKREANGRIRPDQSCRSKGIDLSGRSESDPRGASASATGLLLGCRRDRPERRPMGPAERCAQHHYAHEPRRTETGQLRSPFPQSDLSLCTASRGFVAQSARSTRSSAASCASPACALARRSSNRAIAMDLEGRRALVTGDSS